jgi:C4-type Zn-finger protein
MKTCPVCDGEGVCAYEEAVVDYEHGGYLQEVYGECDMCYGSGEVDDEEEEQ